jgi:hypothetical protein
MDVSHRFRWPSGWFWGSGVLRVGSGVLRIGSAETQGEGEQARSLSPDTLHICSKKGCLRNFSHSHRGGGYLFRFFRKLRFSEGVSRVTGDRHRRLRFT